MIRSTHQGVTVRLPTDNSLSGKMVTWDQEIGGQFQRVLYGPSVIGSKSLVEHI